MASDGLGWPVIRLHLPLSLSLVAGSLLSGPLEGDGLGEGDGLDGAVLGGEGFVFDEVSGKLGMSAQHGARTGGGAFNGCASVGACGESGGYRSGPRGYVKRGTGEGGKGGWGTTGSSAAGLKTSSSLPAIPVKSFILTGSRAHPHAALVMTGKHKHAGAQPEIAGAQPEMSPLPLHSPQGSARSPNTARSPGTARSPSTALVVTLSDESVVTSAAVEEPNVPARIRRAGAQHGVRLSAQYGASSSGPSLVSLGRGGGEGAGAGGGMVGVGGGMAGRHSAVARVRSSGCPDVRDDDLNPARLACKCSSRRGAPPFPTGAR